MKTKKQNVKKGIINLCLILGTTVFMSPANANGIQNQLNSLFDGMVNTTQPGVFETQRRGVISGGRFTAKSRIFTENYVNFTPPSWKGGCGGIDLFGGSFSFINSEQLTQLLRAIASNAAGYAFQLALDNICPNCMKNIAKLQEVIQNMNQHLGNSCQLAQGLVNDISNFIPYDVQHKKGQELTATIKGFFSDTFSATTQDKGTSPTKEIQERDPETAAETKGNLIWRQFRTNNVQFWFSGGNTELMEAIMSMTGSIIIKEPGPDPKSTNSNDFTQGIETLVGGKLKMSDLIDGGRVEIYSCAGDTEFCMDAGNKTKTIDLKGVKQQIWDLLLGQNNLPGTGIIGKFNRNSGALTDTEKAFMSNMPVALGTIVRNLSVLSEQSARMFVHESAGAISLVMTHHLVEEMFRAAYASLANSTSSFKPQAVEALRKSQEDSRAQYAALINEYGSLIDQIERYNSILVNVRKHQYMVRTVTGTAN